MKAIKTNSVWRLVRDYGTGNGYVPANSELTVIGVYPPGTPGIGASDEDVVLADYDRPGTAPQTLAVPVSMFSDICKAVS